MFFSAGAVHGAEQARGKTFDSTRAFSYIERQVQFGPRVPGTKAHEQARDWIAARLKESIPSVTLQPFTGVFGGKKALMNNIIAAFQPDKTNRILLCAHWDSRHLADRDPVPAKRSQPVPGANDGASGVAVLLEVARVISTVKPAVGVDIVLFDGEDGGDYNNDDTWLLGSRHFARVMPVSYRPSFAILLDMIGDRDLSLTRDYVSANNAPELWGRIATGCVKHGIPFLPGESNVLDDHVPLIERGIPSVDLIDFDYPAWHTTSDTPDKCSPESLGKIGALVLDIVYGSK